MGTVIGFITFYWFENPMLPVTICIVILGNILVASVSGVWLPWMWNIIVTLNNNV